VLSGVTAFPLTWEVGLLVQWFGSGDGMLATWLRTVHAGLVYNDQNFPFMAYGTDWLAFGHLMIAVAFYGPWKDPVRNRWVIDFGIIACATVPILAFVCGPIRGIPLGWRVIDSLFGIIGIVPLIFIRRDIDALEVANHPVSSPQ
jgi:hypothetical protein